MGMSPERTALEADLRRDQRETIWHAYTLWYSWVICWWGTLAFAGLAAILGFAAKSDTPYTSAIAPWMISLCVVIGSALEIIRRRALLLDRANAYFAHHGTVEELIWEVRHERFEEADREVVASLSSQWRKSRDAMGDRLGAIHARLDRDHQEGHPQPPPLGGPAKPPRR